MWIPMSLHRKRVLMCRSHQSFLNFWHMLFGPPFREISSWFFQRKFVFIHDVPYTTNITKQPIISVGSSFHIWISNLKYLFLYLYGKFYDVTSDFTVSKNPLSYNAALFLCRDNSNYAKQCGFFQNKAEALEKCWAHLTASVNPFLLSRVR
jgi:hypothetical protein